MSYQKLLLLTYVHLRTSMYLLLLIYVNTYDYELSPCLYSTVRTVPYSGERSES